MIVDLQQNTPEWLEFRRLRIGASDAPVIMEVSPYTTPYTLWERLSFALAPQSRILEETGRYGSPAGSVAKVRFATAAQDRRGAGREEGANGGGIERS